jgi:hypothetical protein
VFAIPPRPSCRGESIATASDVIPPRRGPTQYMTPCRISVHDRFVMRLSTTKPLKEQT